MWKASVETHPVPDTEANRIKEYKAITQVRERERQAMYAVLPTYAVLLHWNMFQFWRKHYKKQNGSAYRTFIDWLQISHEQKKVNPIDNEGRPPRFFEEEEALEFV